MDQRTAEHLTRAQRNWDVAQYLAHQALITPSPDEWSIVAAFYSAVHLVNAYLWEKGKKAPSDHRARRSLMAQDSALDPISDAYDELADWAWTARYSRQPRFTTTQAQQALDDVYEIDRLIRQLLQTL